MGHASEIVGLLDGAASRQPGTHSVVKGQHVERAKGKFKKLGLHEEVEKNTTSRSH